jgi:tetratricopeptide (TPR) repeat protein
MSDQGVSLQRLMERLEREPSAGAIHLLAENFYQQGQFPQAAAASRKGLQLNPDNVELRLILGQSLVALGELTEAEEALKAVAWEIHRLGEVFVTLGRLYELQDRKAVREQAEELHALLMEPLRRLLSGAEAPAPPHMAPPAADPKRLVLTRTLAVLEKWQRVVQLRYQEG